MTFSRRTLLTLAALAALGVGIPACRKMLGQILFSLKAQVPLPALLHNPFKHGSKSLMAVVGGTDVPAMVARAVELIDGLGKLHLVGAHALLQPNVVGGKAPPITLILASSKPWECSCRRRSPPQWQLGRCRRSWFCR